MAIPFFCGQGLELLIAEDGDHSAGHAPDDIGELSALAMVAVTAAIVGYFYAGAMVAAAPAWAREVWTAAALRRAGTETVGYRSPDPADPTQEWPVAARLAA